MTLLAVVAIVALAWLGYKFVKTGDPIWFIISIIGLWLLAGLWVNK